MSARSGCVKRTSAKYTKETRNSPSIPAKECVGQVRKGNDGQWYEPVADKNGRYFWKVRANADTKKSAPASPKKKAASAVKKAVSAKKKSAPASPKKRKASVAAVAPAVEEKDSSKCARKSSQYYAKRDMPPYDAEECQGQERKGNNGRMYRSEYNETLDQYKWYILPDENKRVSASKAKKRESASKVAERKSATASAETSTSTRIESTSGYRAPAKVQPKPVANVPDDATMFASFRRSAVPAAVPVIAAAPRAPAAAAPASSAAQGSRTVPSISTGPRVSIPVPLGETIVVGDFLTDELLTPEGEKLFMATAFTKNGASAGATRIQWPAPINGAATVFATQYGDGEYATGNGDTFSVDSGHIFAMPLSAWRRVRRSIGKNEFIEAEKQLQSGLATFVPSKNDGTQDLLTTFGDDNWRRTLLTDRRILGSSPNQGVLVVHGEEADEEAVDE
jgi:hypothetical protein